MSKTIRVKVGAAFVCNLMLDGGGEAEARGLTIKRAGKTQDWISGTREALVELASTAEALSGMGSGGAPGEIRSLRAGARKIRIALLD